MSITPGERATRTFAVTQEDLAIALGSGDVPVLATPRVVAWCEAVTVEAVAAQLDDDQTTVGSRVMVDHLRPTPLGASVEVSAVISEVDGRQVTFAVAVADQTGDVATGTIVRVVVNRTKFIARISG